MNNSWCPEVGTCRSLWQQFTSKAERDYAASQAPKMLGYIKHTIGGWKHPHQKEVFTLYVYLKEKP